MHQIHALLLIGPLPAHVTNHNRVNAHQDVEHENDDPGNLQVQRLIQVLATPRYTTVINVTVLCLSDVKLTLTVTWTI